MSAEMTVEEFLEHFGTKGMKWGVRKAGKGIVIGSKGAWKTTKFVGRASKATGKFAVKNPEASAAMAIGTTYVASKLLRSKGSTPISNLGNTAFESRDATGKLIGKMGTMLYPETVRMLSKS